MQEHEALLDFEGYKTWYSVYGDLKSGVTPLIGLHGGPAWPHYSLMPLTALASRGIPVVLYDQLGCGKSDRPDDSSIYSVGLFVEELEALRKHLGLDKIDLLGHSWGGTLALEYVLAYPERVRKLVLNSPLLDTKLWVEEADKLKDQLPDGLTAIMRKHEVAGTTDSNEYQAAYKVFQENFVCRIVPQPELYDKADAEWGKEVYRMMWGPSEAYATGTLKNYSVLDKLGNIPAPTLLISGKYDEATPAQMQLAQKDISNCRWTLLENSSHSALFEETDKYLRTLEKFLSEASPIS